MITERDEVKMLAQVVLNAAYLSKPNSTRAIADVLEREITTVLLAYGAQQLAEGRRQGLEEAAEVARTGCLVPPDGGSPTKEEMELCDEIEKEIRSLMENEDGKARGCGKGDL